MARRISHAIYAVILALVLAAVVFSCRKDTEVNQEAFEIEKENERVVAGTTMATVTGTYSYTGRVNSIRLRVGESELLAGSEVFVAEVSGKAYSVSVTGLKSGTVYHYRYEVDYGAKEDYLTEIDEFVTQSESPTVKTLEALALDSTTFRVKCEVLADGGSEVTERGICWNTFGDPILDDDVIPYASGGLGQYAIRLGDLSSNAIYYVRAYAKNAKGVGFGEVMELQTGGGTTTPRVSTVEVSGITYNTAQCLGNVSSDGGLPIIERGACWGLEPDPTVNVHHAVAQTAETGTYSVTLDNLRPSTTYHVRCYAANEKGIAYGEEQTFTTTEGLPTVVTAAITNVTATGATGGGNVTDEGASAVTERGICWSTSHEPMATGSHQASGTGAGAFTCGMTNLTPNETYYVRAYATNGQGTAYGAEVEFTAKEGLPVVETRGVTDITTVSAKAHGEVTDQGGSPVTERGVCWSTEPSPSISGTHASGGTGSGEFEVDMTHLAPGTHYYVRAYAINGQGMTYGGQEEFTTQATLPTVETGDISGTTASGEVTDEGGAAVTERGVCWSTSHNPTIEGSHVSSGSGLGVFSVELTDLAPGTTYYVRAYATNSAGTAYGTEKTLATEANLPSVTTGEVSNISQTAAQGSGNVIDDGGADVTERGVCWGTGHNPTVSGSHASSGTGIGNFTVSMTGLTANTHYFVRAYARNSAGISYGNEVDFTTSQNISAPTVTTSQVTNITQTTATGGGNVTNDGGASVTERGICWSTNHNPTTSGSHASSGTSTGTFTVNMTGLTPGTTYYVRAYAVNSQGTSYGNEVSFTTEQTPTFTVSVSSSPAAGGTAHVGSVTGPTSGTYTAGQSCTVYAVASSGYGFVNWTVNGAQASTSANYTFTVSGSRTLVANFVLQVTLPSVTTSQVTSITQTTATGGGNVTGNGGATVTARGICWSTSHNPTTSGSHAAASSGGTGSFTVNMTGLTPGTTYYVRAYATNSAGTEYGNEVSFTTSQTPSYTVSVSANPAGGGTVTGGGTYQQGQSCTVTAMPASGYTFSNWTENGVQASASASYQFTVTGNRSLVANFTLQATLPAVTTSQVTNITQTTATGGGNVTNDGNATVTERGICWGTSHNPTTTGSHASSGTGTGTFTVDMTSLTPGTTYYVRAYAINSVGMVYGNEVSFTTNSSSSHAYVDLGLPSGLLWATCNLGADSPEDYGNYFAWAETTTKNNYSWNTYQYCMGSINTLTKYCNDASHGYNGFTDNLFVLQTGDDAAVANWGSGWRMPTGEEWLELLNNTTVTWTTQNGVNGRRFTASNGNSIFLPAAGYRDGGSLNSSGAFGLYWSSTLFTSNPSAAYYLGFGSGDCSLYGYDRNLGQAVRPVRSASNN